TTDPVTRWYELNHLTCHTRFPVINEKKRVCGMVTSKDVIGKDENVNIQTIMSKKTIVVKEKTSLAYVAHMMVWEGIEIVPVVDDADKLRGIVSRQDVLKALQQIQRQPQVGETIDDIVASNLEAKNNDHTVFETSVVPQMTSQLGT